MGRRTHSWRVDEARNQGPQADDSAVHEVGETSPRWSDLGDLHRQPSSVKTSNMNPFAERWVGGLRRDCLDHIIAINEGQLRRVVGEYVEYFHEDRTHLGLEKDTPVPRAVEPPAMGSIVAFPRVGGLHHRYSRHAPWAA